MRPRWEGIGGWLLGLAGAYFLVWSVVELGNLAPVAGALGVLVGLAPFVQVRPHDEARER